MGLGVSSTEGIENRLTVNAFVIGNAPQNAVERADAHRSVSWNSDAVRSWILRLQNDVAAYLVDLQISPTLAERSGEIMAAQVTREFHRRASTSSRTRCKRMPVGFGRSK